MKVPIIRFEYSQEDKDFVKDGAEKILATGALTAGSNIAEFERGFAAWSGAAHGIATNSGTSAIELILAALGVEGKSVIVPTNTFLATALAVMKTRNRVIFCDANLRTLCPDADDVLARIEPDTEAVLWVHIGGIIDPGILRVREVCLQKGIHLIEDCAHAHGCSLGEEKAGTIGVAGAFSFFPTKVLTTGEGGAVITNDTELASRVRMLRNHGKNPLLGNKMSEFGDNFRMSELTGLLGVQQMKKADWIAGERRRAAEYYDRHLGGIERLRPAKLPAKSLSTYYKYICHLDDGVERGALKKLMKEKYAVALTGEVYADLCHNEPLWRTYTLCGARRRNQEKPACACYPKCGVIPTDGDFPKAVSIASSHICPPVYPGLSDEELEHVVGSLRQAILEIGAAVKV